MIGSQHRIAVIGTGYVGLTTGACMAKLGHHVTCMDIDEMKIAGIVNGIMPIHEEGLAEIVRSGRLSNRLVFTSNLVDAV